MQMLLISNIVISNFNIISNIDKVNGQRNISEIVHHFKGNEKSMRTVQDAKHYSQKQ